MPLVHIEGSQRDVVNKPAGDTNLHSLKELGVIITKDLFQIQTILQPNVVRFYNILSRASSAHLFQILLSIFLKYHLKRLRDLQGMKLFNS